MPSQFCLQEVRRSPQACAPERAATASPVELMRASVVERAAPPTDQPPPSPLALALKFLVETPGESGNKGQIFLQQAETVRLISPTLADDSADGVAVGAVGGGWRPLSVTDVEGGEPLLMREVRRGTHVGRAIDAIVSES